MKYIVSCCLLFITAVALAEPPKIVPRPKPNPVKVETIEGAVVGKMFEMSVEPGSKWRTDQNDNTDLRSYDNGKTGVFLANAPGTYSILVLAPSGEYSEYKIVVVDDLTPKPPIPVPPVDELKSALKKAFDAETGDLAAKKELAKDLAELYKQAATLAGKAEVKTSGDLLKRCQEAATTLIGNDKMLGVRKLVATQLSGILPSDAPLTDNQRKSVAELFKKLAVILESFGV